MALQIRRGTDSDRLTITPSAGEPLYTTDTKKLYIGDGSTAGGNIVSGSDTDSASVSAIILNDVDSAYVQARQDLAYSSLTGAPTAVSSFTNDANYLDSTSVQGVIDATYIQSNQTTYDFLDSSEAIALIDSAYVQARQTTDLSSSTTSDLTEGTNLYYTTARADSDFDIRFATKTTDNLTEGSTNLYYTTAKADSDAKNAISVTDAGGDGSLSYSESTGVLTYTGPSASEVRAHLVAGTGVTYDSAAGSISIGQAVGTSDSVVFSALSTTGTVIVGGDLQVNGTTVTVNATDLNVTDNMIYLNDGESSGSPTASIDIGFAANVNDQGSYEHVGFFRDATDQTFKVFQGYTPEPDSSVQINTGHASFTLAPFEASTLSGVYLGFDSDFSAKASTTNVSSFINDANYLDSSTATSLVDSAYIEARRPAETVFSIVNNGTSAYTFSGDGFPSTADNPTIYLTRGKTYKFGVNASGHPFQIRLSDGGSAYSDGVTNNGAQTGDVIFTVPMNAPNTLVYQCTVHSGMVGDIKIFNENSFLDSSSVTNVIDATYIQANQTTYDFLDSSEAIALIDSAYVQARQSAGTDSATVIALIDSDYVQARQITPIPSFTKVSISGQGNVIADSDEGTANWASGSQQQKLTASDAATNDRFAYDLDISGDGNYALVAAPWESSQKGKAYVYLRTGTTWSEQATLTGSDTQGNDYFGIGTKISEDGSTAVIGAKGAGSGINGTGKAYVYKRSGTSWTQQAALTASDAADGDLFGYAVDISDDGNTIVLGAYGEDTGGNARGQAYVFTRDSDEGSIWTEQQKFQASDTEDGDNFGFAVAMSGDGNNLIVGVPFEDTNGSGAGSAYIFTRSGETWSQQAKIQASDAAANQEFGYSVDMSTDGNTIALGSRDDTGGGNRGAAFIFVRSGSTWSQQAKLENSNEADFDLFAAGGRGVSLSGSGNVLVVGAYGDDDNGSQSGSTFVFTRSGTTWSQAKQIATSDAAASDENGFAVAIDKNGDTILTGSYGKTSSTGAAYVWTAPLAVQLQDTLTLEAGSNITITTDASTDTVTIAASSSIDSAATIALMNAAGLNVPDNVNITAGADSDLKIYHDGSRSYISDQGTGELRILSSQLEIKNASDDATGAVFTANAGASLYYNNSKKLETTDSGVNITGEITADSATISGLKYPASDGLNNQVIRTDGSGNLSFVSVAAISGAIDSAGVISLIDSSYVESKIIDAEGTIISIDTDLTTTDSAQVIHTFDKTTYRTVKYIAQLEYDTDSSYHSEELLVTHNGTAVAMTSYAKILLDSDLGTFDARVSGSNIELTLSPTKVNTSVKLRAIRTLA